MGSPIRTSPDHRLLASPRGFSQLATSFFAYLRQGIHTHALSSLTIKLTPKPQSLVLFVHVFASAPLQFHSLQGCATTDSNLLLCTAPLRSPPKRCPFTLYSARQIFNCQRSMKFSVFSFQLSVKPLKTDNWKLTTSYWWAWVDSNYRPHPYQGCALTT